MQVAQIPLLVIPVFSVVVIVATLTMLLALVDVFNRDIRYVLNNIITVWFFLAPIVYTKRMTEQHLRFIAWIDPMAWVIKQFQQLLVLGRADQRCERGARPRSLSIVIFGAGLVVFRRATIGLAKFV